MHDTSKKDKPGQKVLFIRVDQAVYDAVAAIADEEDRSINWMATSLLKSAISQRKRNDS